MIIINYNISNRTLPEDWSNKFRWVGGGVGHKQNRKRVVNTDRSKKMKGTFYGYFFCNLRKVKGLFMTGYNRSSSKQHWLNRNGAPHVRNVEVGKSKFIKIWSNYLFILFEVYFIKLNYNVFYMII